MKVEIGRKNGKFTASVINEEGKALPQEEFGTWQDLRVCLKKERAKAKAEGKSFKVVVRKPA